VVYRKPLDAPMFTLDSWRGAGPEPHSLLVGDQLSSAPPTPVSARAAARRTPTGSLYPHDARPGLIRESLPDPRVPVSQDPPRTRRGTSELRLVSNAEVAALKADIDPEAWETLYRTKSRPFRRPEKRWPAVSCQERTCSEEDFAQERSSIPAD
jgi:hypothetical protein